jgi:hypothetical protein
MHLAVTALHGDIGLGQSSMSQTCDPGPGADDDLVAADAPRSVSTAATAPELSFLEAGDLHAGQDAHILVLGLLGETVDRLGVVGVAALLLVQHRGDALGLPVVEDAPHVEVMQSSFALDEDRLVADLLLLLVDRRHVPMHRPRG